MSSRRHGSNTSNTRNSRRCTCSDVGSLHPSSALRNRGRTFYASGASPQDAYEDMFGQAGYDNHNGLPPGNFNPVGQNQVSDDSWEIPPNQVGGNVTPYFSRHYPTNVDLQQMGPDDARYTSPRSGLSMRSRGVPEHYLRPNSNFSLNNSSRHHSPRHFDDLDQSGGITVNVDTEDGGGHHHVERSFSEHPSQISVFLDDNPPTITINKNRVSDTGAANANFSPFGELRREMTDNPNSSLFGSRRQLNTRQQARRRIGFDRSHGRNRIELENNRELGISGVAANLTEQLEEPSHLASPRRGIRGHNNQGRRLLQDDWDATHSSSNDQRQLGPSGVDVNINRGSSNISIHADMGESVQNRANRTFTRGPADGPGPSPNNIQVDVESNGSNIRVVTGNGAEESGAGVRGGGSFAQIEDEVERVVAEILESIGTDRTLSDVEEMVEMHRCRMIERQLVRFMADKEARVQRRQMRQEQELVQSKINFQVALMNRIAEERREQSELFEDLVNKLRQVAERRRAQLPLHNADEV